jgi:hypothetical protein
MKALKIVLVVMGVLCFLSSAPGAVAPWSSIVHWLGVLGLDPVPEQPFVVYCVRLSSLGFALIGVFFLVIATNPLRYRPLLALAVWGLLLTAVLAFSTGRMVGMPPLWYLVDTVSSLLAAVLLLLLWPRAPSAAAESEG